MPTVRNVITLSAPIPGGPALTLLENPGDVDNG